MGIKARGRNTVGPVVRSRRADFPPSVHRWDKDAIESRKKEAERVENLERGREKKELRESKYLSDNAHLSLLFSPSRSFSAASSVLVSHSLYTCRCLSADLFLPLSFSRSIHRRLLLILLIFLRHSRAREQPGYSPTHARDDDDDDDDVGSAGCRNMQTPNGRFPVWRAAL